MSKRGEREYKTVTLTSTGDGQPCVLGWVFRIWNKSTSKAVIEFDDGDQITLDAGEKWYDLAIASSSVDVVTLDDNEIEITGMV